MGLVSLFTLLGIAFSRVYGLPNGIDTCESVPGHGTWARGCNPNTCISTGGTVAAVPYGIVVLNNNLANLNFYMPNTQYSVILSSTNSLASFRGFVFNVGRGNINGNFAAISAASYGAGNLTTSFIDNGVRHMTQCANGLTHTSANDKYSAQFTWYSPQSGSGSVMFKSVIVATRTSVNYVISLRLNEMNTNPTMSSSLTPSSVCSIPYTAHAGTSGVTQSYIISSAGSTSILGGISPTCASGSGTSSGAKLAFMIDLGANTLLTGLLTVDTCLTAIGDTVLYVGTGCPSTTANFRCLSANDDAGSSICPSDSMASQVRLNVSTRYVWVVVGNYASSTSASSGIRWWYNGDMPPSVPTRSIVSSAILTPSSIISLSATPRSSRTPSRSNSNTQTPSATISIGLQPSQTDTSSISVNPSISSSISASQTFSDSSSKTNTESSSNSITSMETYTPSNTKSMPASPPQTPTSSASATVTPLETDTPSTSATDSSSYTANPSFSSGSSLTQTSEPSIFSTSTGTGTGRQTQTPTANINAMPYISPAPPVNTEEQGNNFGMISLGVSLGIILTIIVIASYYVIHKKNKKQSRPISMRNIVYLGEHQQTHSDNNIRDLSGGFRYSNSMQDSPRKQTFEPLNIKHADN